jgi:UDP-N-acetyl-D-galactosamine dehydrogenase
LDDLRDLSALILAVPHDAYAELDPATISGMTASSGVVVDVKAKMDPTLLREDITFWSL